MSLRAIKKPRNKLSVKFVNTIRTLKVNTSYLSHRITAVIIIENKQRLWVGGINRDSVIVCAGRVRQIWRPFPTGSCYKPTPSIPPTTPHHLSPTRPSDSRRVLKKKETTSVQIYINSNYFLMNFDFLINLRLIEIQRIGYFQFFFILQRWYTNVRPT